VAVTGVDFGRGADVVIAEMLIAKDPWLVRRTVTGRTPRLYESKP
jgi:hypothetical protein